jgi:hypothetical protein
MLTPRPHRNRHGCSYDDMPAAQPPPPGQAFPSAACHPPHPAPRPQAQATTLRDEPQQARDAHWQIWVVHRVVGGPVWCARRWDDEHCVLNAYSPEELVECLEEQASE